MNIIIAISIFLLSLIFSGVLYMFGVVQLTPVPYNIWLISSMALFFLAFKIRFKNKNVFKFFLKRKWVEFNGWFNKMDKKITVGNHKLTPMQQRAAKLWKISLRDKNCVLRCSISTKERHLESGKILMVLKATSIDTHKMIIYDNNENTKCNFYEVIIPQPQLDETRAQFDAEMDKRMFDCESVRKEIVEDTMELMLKNQESLIREKNQVLQY